MYPLERVRDRFEVVAVAFRAGLREPPVGDLQVDTDDEPVVLTLQKRRRETRKLSVVDVEDASRSVVVSLLVLSTYGSASAYGSSV